MKIIKTILTLIFLITTNMTFACDCELDGHFLTVAPKSKLVALVKVNNYISYINLSKKKTPLTMEVEIVEVYFGEEIRKTVTVWGEDGILCRPPLSFFKIDNYYVIAFEQNSNENPLDYAISYCGDYWLKADNEKKIAIGQVSEKQSEILFSDLKEFFQGDKTKDLTSNDFKEIFQLAFDFPKLQNYFNLDTKGNQIILQYFGDGNHKNLKGVKKIGKKLKYLMKKKLRIKISSITLC